MPKPMLKQPETKMQSNNILSATYKKEQKQENSQLTKMQIDRILRKSRSKKYMDALHRLDAGGHVHNQDKVNELIDIIREEFPEVEISGILLGYVSICYLGKPYEVHIFDMTGHIIEHYQAGHPLPGGMEKARALAMRGGYEFIEVYVDCCRCISANGTVSVVNC